MAAKVVAFMNQKGGVGKTTTAVNMGSIIANEYGRSVLLVDLDSQGHLSDHVGVDPGNDGNSIYDVLMEGMDPRQAIRRVHGFEVLPANRDLSSIEIELAGLEKRELRFRDAMNPLLGQYDYIFMDFPPNLGLLTISGLALAGEVIVPMEAEYLALRGLGQLRETVAAVSDGLSPGLAITGVLFCRFDGRTTLAKEVRAEVEKYFPGKVYAAPIRKNIRLAEAPSRGLPINIYDSACAGSQDYRQAAAEFLDRRGDGAIRSRDPDLDGDILAQTPVIPDDPGGRGEWQRHPVWRGSGNG